MVCKGLDNCCSQEEKKIEKYPISDVSTKMKWDKNTDPNSLQNCVLTIQVSLILVIMEV